MSNTDEIVGLPVLEAQQKLPGLAVVLKPGMRLGQPSSPAEFVLWTDEHDVVTRAMTVDEWKKTR